MIINYVEGTLRPYNNNSRFKIHSEEIFDVQKVMFSFMKKNIEYVCLDSVHRYFFYNDRRTFLEIQRLMYDNPAEIRSLLIKYYSSSGIMKDLLIALYSTMCSVYNTYGFNHLDGFDRHFELSDVYDPIHGSTPELIETTNDDIYNELRFLMPQNISKKRAEIAEQERVKKIKLAEQERAKKEKEAAEQRLAAELVKLQKKSNAIELERTIACTYDQSLNLLVSFKSDTNTNAEVLFKTLDQIEKQKKLVQELYTEGFYSSEKNNELTKKLNEIHNKLSEQVSTVIDQQRAYEFGSISENKIKLRTSIHKLNFTELLEMYRDYKYQEEAFKRRKETSKRPLEKDSYDSYIKLYKYGEILISDRMNHLNRNPSKQKHIPQDMLDQAMCFYYDADSISAAYETQRKEKYTQEKESGNVGESRVKEALKWLDSSYVQIKPLSKDFSGNACIQLHNPDYLDVNQEYDHILVGKAGVFQIETKNYSGKLIIDNYGNWRRILQDGKEVGAKNPLEQVRKHEKVLSSFLGNGINICSIICIANDSAIIEGIENSPLPIVKSDMLVEYIENYVCEKPPLDPDSIQSCVQSIYEHMLKS